MTLSGCSGNPKFYDSNDSLQCIGSEKCVIVTWGFVVNRARDIEEIIILKEKLKECRNQ